MSKFSAARGGRSLRAATTTCSSCARELAEVRACVQALQVERDDLRAEVAKQNMEGRPRNARSLAVPSPDHVMGDNSVQPHSVLAIRSGRNASSDGDPHRPSRFECQVEPSFQSDVQKYGLRGIRVGEASHPSPVSCAKSRRTQMDSDSDAPLVISGRFMALSRESDGSDEDVGAEPARSQSSKRLRVTRRDCARLPQETHSRETPRA